MGEIIKHVPQILTPENFQARKAQLAEWRESIFRRVVRVTNEVLCDLAGNKGQSLDSEEQLYVKFLRESDRHSVPENFIIIRLGGLAGCPLDDNLLPELRQLFIDSGWGEKSQVIAQNGYDLWAIVEPIFEEEDEELDLENLDREALIKIVLDRKLASYSKAHAVDIDDLREMIEENLEQSK